MSELRVDKVSPRTGNYVSLNTVGSKNIVINGDMSIAQRSTSVAGITSGGYYTVDRFDITIDTIGTWTMSQDTDVPTGQGFAKSLKIDCTTADAAPAAADRMFIKYKSEGQNLQYLKKGTASAESVTASFWVKSNKTGTYIAELFDVDNTRQISKAYTILAANTWEKKTITFEGDTTGTLDNDNASSLQLTLFLGVGTDYTSGTLNTSWNANTNANRAVGQVNLADSTSNYINITGVQLEAGTTASDFEFLPVDVNLQRCQRYFQKSYDLATAPGTNTTQGDLEMGLTSNAANDVLTTIPYKVSMRATPTITYYTTAGTSGSWGYARSGASGNATMTAYANRYGQNYSVSYLGSGAAFTAVSVIGHFKADAEL